jgi:uncharacterized protein
MAPYRILSLDGGGIRGIFTARLLERIDRACPDFLRQIDLFAGTSTGGILALGLASGISPAQLVELYGENGASIFDDSWIDDLRDLAGLAGAEYCNEGLKCVLERVFAGQDVRRLGDLRPRVLIPTFDLDPGVDPRRAAGQPRRWKPKFFHNYPGADSDCDELVVDVAVRTTAAPTYFPTAGRFIDGGVIANQPALAALAQALHPATGRQSLGDVRLLSIGTGINPTYIEGENHDWGYAHWAKPIIRVMLEGGMDVVDYQCRQILAGAYHRVSCVLDEVIPLDCYQKAAALVAIADRVDLSATLGWLREQG